MMTGRRAALILFLEGLASSGLQMITLRQTVPFVGSSVLTTSIVISIFLAALSLGYYWGGQQRHDRYARSLVTNLLMSIAIFGVGLSYSFVNFFFTSIENLTQLVPFLHNPLVHLGAFCLIVMAPLVFFLAQTVPLILNVASQNSTKSQAAGNATALSTFGSVIGCLFTGLYLMYVLGVGYSIFLNCLILSACLIFLIDWKESSAKWALGFATIFLFISFTLNVRVTGDLFAATTPYSNFSVADHPDGKRFVINRSNASFIGKENRKGWPYIELIKNGLFSDDMTGKDILVLGAGGFTLSAEFTKGANFTYVDIDKQIENIAEQLFLEEPINGTFVAHDARNYLLTNDKKWDVIIVDLYANAASIPMHTSTYEFFTLVGSRLNGHGKAILNIAANPRLNDDYSANMDFTIRTALSRCITDITGYSNSPVNIVYFCSKKPKENVASLYRDDTTRVAIDGHIAAMQHKKWELSER